MRKNRRWKKIEVMDDSVYVDGVLYGTVGEIKITIKRKRGEVG